MFVQLLSLVNCRELTDAGLAFVAEGCKELRDLSLKWCIMVSDRGVCTLAKQCRQLVSLDLSYTQVLGTNGVDSFGDLSGELWAESRGPCGGRSVERVCGRWPPCRGCATSAWCRVPT